MIDENDDVPEDVEDEEEFESEEAYEIEGYDREEQVNFSISRMLHNFKTRMRYHNFSF